MGVKPTEVKVRNLVAWIEGERETELSSIDKAIYRMVSECVSRKGWHGQREVDPSG